jgi:hypothetical protein
LSSKNLICSPLWILKEEDFRKWSLAFIRPYQKCESPNLQWTSTIVLFLKYFFLRSSCQTPSSFINLNSSRQIFYTSRFIIPKTHCSFGRHKIPNFVNLYFFLWLSPSLPEKLDL